MEKIHDAQQALCMIRLLVSECHDVLPIFHCLSLVACNQQPNSFSRFVICLGEVQGRTGSRSLDLAFDPQKSRKCYQRKSEIRFFEPESESE